MSDALYWYKHFRELEVSEGRIVLIHLTKDWLATRERRENITSEEWIDYFSADGKTAL